MQTLTRCVDVAILGGSKGGSSSVVERDLAKVDVAGSTPVSRSSGLRCQLPSDSNRTACELLKARYPSGKGEVCKTFMRRFDPDPRLHHF